jgi:hypothetical protein
VKNFLQSKRMGRDLEVSKEKYLAYATHCIELAGEATTCEERLQLLQMAQSWHRFAQRAEEIGRLVDDGRALGILPEKSNMN